MVGPSTVGNIECGPTRGEWWPSSYVWPWYIALLWKDDTSNTRNVQTFTGNTCIVDPLEASNNNKGKIRKNKLTNINGTRRKTACVASVSARGRWESWNGSKRGKKGEGRGGKKRKPLAANQACVGVAWVSGASGGKGDERSEKRREPLPPPP